MTTCLLCWSVIFFFFFNDTATTEIYTLSLHDALPISALHGRVMSARRCALWSMGVPVVELPLRGPRSSDRKSTRLNSSHANISYAVFCLKKKKTMPARYPTACTCRRLLTTSHTVLYLS